MRSIEMSMHITFHCGPTGNHTGLGAFLEQMKGAGFTPSVMSADSYGQLFDATNRGGFGCYRLSTAGQGGSYQFDVGNTSLPPAQAAPELWQATLKRLPPEFDKNRAWLMIFNEGNKALFDWYATTGLILARTANIEGYKVAFGGWSSGEPEKEQWHSESVLELLRYCAENQDKCGIHLHEYNYGFVPYQSNYPWHVGRFQFMFDACDQNGIARPSTFITEYGWSYDQVPGWNDAADYLQRSFDLYSRFEQIKLVAIWNLGSNLGGVGNETQALMQPLGNWLAQVGPQPSSPDAPLDPDYFQPAPPAQTLEEAILDFGLEHKVIDTNSDAALEKAILADGYFQTGDEHWLSWGADKYATQPAYDPASGADRVYYAKVPNWHDVKFVQEGEPIEPPIVPPGSNPLAGIKLGPFFRVPYQITSRFNDPRDYGNLKHEGIDLMIFGAPPDSKEPVLCGYPGTVVGVKHNPQSAYYNYVIVRHVAGPEAAKPGTVFFTWYCHLDSMVVSVGQAVTRGTFIGEVGGTGGVWNEHLHLNVQLESGGLAGYVVPNVIDPEPIITLQTTGRVDLLPYFLGRTHEAHMQQASWGPQEKIRVIHDEASKRVLHVKNNNWEEMFYDASFIYRKTDTSPGHHPDNGRELYYTLRDTGSSMSKWMVRQAAPGDWFKRSPAVHFFYSDNCQPAYPAYPDVTWLNVVAIHKSYRFNLTGVTMSDVLELAWARTQGGPAIERYWYAGGLVGWFNVGDGRNSAIASYTVADNQPKVIGCL